MFKNKNRITKISNWILIFMIVAALASGVNYAYSLYKNDIVEGLTKADYIYNVVMSLAYFLLCGLSLFLLNKKINLYKDEYPLSRQIFNLMNLILFISLGLSLIMLISGYFIYDKFSFYALTSYIMGFTIIGYSHFYVNKGNMLSVDNSKKVNIVNFIIIFLFREYVYDIVLSLLQLIFKVNKTLDIVKNMTLYLIGICIVLLAYKLFEKAKIKEKEEAKVIKEVKVVKKKSLTKKKNSSKKEVK